MKTETKGPGFQDQPMKTETKGPGFQDQPMKTATKGPGFQDQPMKTEAKRSGVSRPTWLGVISLKYEKTKSILSFLYRVHK